MYIDRLQLLADKLRTVAPEDYDQAAWVFECGSAACALGHACVMPEFRTLGLGFMGRLPCYRGITGVNAGKDFFHLTHTQAMLLFDCQPEMTPKEKAAQIEAMIREFVTGQP
jgi:hypothetical protein